jgi:soluble lytic murein transglycosylase-like protein
MLNAYYSPKPMNAIKAPAASPKDIVSSTAGAIGGIQEIGAAKAFQDHLDRGYTAMVETLKELPPEVAAGIPSPEAYADSEDKRVAWYASVNDAIAKSNILGQAQDPTSSPDALRTAAAAAPLGDASQKAVGGEIDRLDNRQQTSAIQKAAGMFEAPAPPAAAAPAPNIDLKSQFGRGLKIKLANMAPHMDSINSAAGQAGIPPTLVMAVAAQESGGNVDATSSTGVKGTMQVTNGTFKDMAEKYPDAGLTDRTDPAQSYTAGALYLGELVKDFDGNVQAAMAAYNAGPSSIKAAMKKYPDDWVSHLEEFMDKDKAQEAANYVASVDKNFSALGGGTFSQPKKAPTQNEFNQALLKENPQAVINPVAKEIKSGLKNDAYIEAKAGDASFKQASQDRLNAKFKAELDYKTYQKVNNYNKQIEKVSPAAQGVMRIDQLVGGLDNNKPIAGFGFGEKAFRKFLQTDASPEARDMRIAFGNLFADIGLATSGQNFTAKEMEKLDLRLGNTFWSDESAFRAAIKQQRERLYQQMLNPWNALPDNVKNELIDAGTMNPEMFGDFKSDVIPGKKPDADSTTSGLPPEKAARLAELRAKKANGTLK